MNGRFYIVILCLLLTACPSNVWIADPSPEADYHRCNPGRFGPQLIMIPGFDNTWQIVENCDVYPREKTAIALRVFLGEWEAVLGNSEFARRSFDELIITWKNNEAEAIYSGYTIDGFLVENVRVKGSTLNSNTIHIYQEPYGQNKHERVCESALAHELIHVVLWKIYGHGDPDHLGSKYRGWTHSHSLIVQRTNKALCELGI